MVNLQTLIMGLVMSFMVVAAIGTFMVTWYNSRKKKLAQDGGPDDPNAVVVVDAPVHKQLRSNEKSDMGMHDTANNKEDVKENVKEKPEVEDGANGVNVVENDRDVDAKDAETVNVTDDTADTADVPARNNLNSQ